MCGSSLGCGPRLRLCWWFASDSLSNSPVVGAGAALLLLALRCLVLMPRLALVPDEFLALCDPSAGVDPSMRVAVWSWSARRPRLVFVLVRARDDPSAGVDPSVRVVVATRTALLPRRLVLPDAACQVPSAGDDSSV